MSIAVALVPSIVNKDVHLHPFAPFIVKLCTYKSTDGCIVKRLLVTLYHF